MNGVVVSSRVSDDLAAEVDRIAIANGMTRASFIEDTLKRAVLSKAHEALPLTPVQERGHPDDYAQIKVRLHHREVEAIDEVAEPLGLTRAEWIKRTIRWRLWDRAGVLRLAPTTRTEIGKVRKELLRIGRNVNQAVHAMNAENLPGSALQIDRIAEQFLHESRELSSALSETRRVVSRSVGAEVGYWASAYERSKA